MILVNTLTQILFGTIILLYSADSYADMYKYVDASGAVSITNSLQSVPQQYRAAMTVVKEERITPKKLLPEVQNPVSDPLPQAVKASRPALQTAVTVTPQNNKSRYLRSALIIGGLVASYFLIGRLTGALGFPKVGILLFISLLLVGGVYLYGLYVRELSNVFGVLRKDALNIKKNVESREQKSEQLIRQKLENDPE